MANVCRYKWVVPVHASAELGSNQIEPEKNKKRQIHKIKSTKNSTKTHYFLSRNLFFDTKALQNELHEWGHGVTVTKMF